MARILKIWAALACVVCVSGCQSYAADDDTMGTSISIINTVENIPVTSVRFNGQPIGQTGDGGCCVDVPKTWHPGMTATIEWSVDEHPGYNLGGAKSPSFGTKAWEEWADIHEKQYIKHKAIVPIARFTTVTVLSVVILPCNQVAAIWGKEEYDRVFLNWHGDLYEAIKQRLGAKKSCPTS